MKLLVAALTLAVAGGCHRRANPCAPGTRSKLEVRNGAGALVLAWKGDALCDGQLRPVGTLRDQKGTVTLADNSGKLELELHRESPTVGRGRDAAGPSLRLYRDDHELRVLRGDGVPYGSVVPETTCSNAMVLVLSVGAAKFTADFRGLGDRLRHRNS